MTRKEIINEVQAIEDEIKDLRLFLGALEYEHTKSSRRRTECLLSRTVKLSFMGMTVCRRAYIVSIPNYMIADIAAKCIMWIEELEAKANELIGLKNK